MSRKHVLLYEEPLPDGRCNYRLPYIDPITRKNKKLSVIMSKQSAANRKIALSYLQEKLDALLIKKQSPALGDLVDDFLLDRSHAVKASTLHQYEIMGRLILESFGRDVLLSDLSVPYIRAVIKEKTEAASTFNNYLHFLRMLFKWAYRNDYLPSPALADKLQGLPDKRRERIEDKYLEKSELDALLAACTLKHWNLAIRFLVLSGLRVGELIALNDSDIDGDYIHVTKTFELKIGLVDTPKSADSFRDVYIRPELAACIREIRSFVRVRNFSRGIKSPLFFPSEAGSWLNYPAFGIYLGRKSEEVLGRRITPHALRHTAASLLIAEGVPLDVVSRMLGHKNSQITKDIYFHITEELQKKDAAILRDASIL